MNYDELSRCYLAIQLAHRNFYTQKAPPESLDCNPIENLWHELKEFLRREVKPHTKDELLQGILQLWDTVDVAKCTRYIRHLGKVLPRIIKLNGDAAGY